MDKVNARPKEAPANSNKLIAVARLCIVLSIFYFIIFSLFFLFEHIINKLG